MNCAKFLFKSNEIMYILYNRNYLKVALKNGIVI